MKPRIHVITLAVADLERALAFYREGLGFQSEGLIGTEFKGDESTPDGTTAVFQLDGGLMLSIYPRSELAKDALVPLTPAKSGEFSIGHAVASRAEVDEIISQAEVAGAVLTERPHDRPWGIYSGYFRDPDGHLWEVLWNPALDLDPSE
jgi:catechol 2,3-dioxygenase-like lactoylglutathione lyase family enzyme